MHRDFDHFFKSVRLRRKNGPAIFRLKNDQSDKFEASACFTSFENFLMTAFIFFLSLAIWRISNYIKRSKIQK